MILLVDNYDSFVFNLARYFERLGQSTHVVRNDAIDPAAVRRLNPSAIVISPGPCAPDQAGSSLELIGELHREYPMLGVCLGHQAIAQAFGGEVVRAVEPMHGSSSEILHDSRGIFAGLPNPLIGCRYHSLVVREASLPECLEVSARTPGGVVMGLRHRELPVVGVQFHPESILTDHGYELLAGFLRLAGVSVPNQAPTLADELALRASPTTSGAARPVVFPETS